MRIHFHFVNIFCMKLGYHKGTKLTSPDFSGKFLFRVFGAKRVQKWPKIGSLSFFSRLLHYFFLILDPNFSKLGPIKLLLSVSPSVCLRPSVRPSVRQQHTFLRIGSLVGRRRSRNVLWFCTCQSVCLSVCNHFI